MHLLFNCVSPARPRASVTAPLCLLVAFLALAGCGGGGSSSSTPAGGAAPPVGVAPPAGSATSITIQRAPASQAVADGQSAVLDVMATSSSRLTYQWQRDGMAIIGATGTTYVTPALALADSGVRYSVLLGNGGGSTQSVSATVTVRAVAPTITGQPQDRAVASGQSTTFTVQVQGSQPLSYQWQRNGVDVPGATTASLDIASVATSDDGARYRALVRNAASQVVSEDAVLRVNSSGPVVVSMFQNAVVAPGQRLVIRIGVTGTPPFNFRWSRNGQPVDGAAGTTDSTVLSLTTPQLTMADDGVRYALTIDTAQGSQQTPDVVISVISPARVAGGESHSLARSADGRVWAWGDNAHGQLGLGTTIASATPVVIPDLGGVTAIATGDNHSLALKDDGTVWAWGQNSAGALGDGSQTDRSTPQRVGTLSGVVAIAAGGGRSFALRNDGTLWGWGDNNTGALGLGHQNQVLVPVAVGGGVAEFRDILAVAAGTRHTLALRADGRVFAFGEVAVPLADGIGLQSSPVMVDGVTLVAGITAGNGFSVAMDIIGRLYSWGLNGDGQLGLGNTLSTARPTLITGSASGMLPSTGMAAGRDFVLVRPLGGPFLAWGAGANGQLGTGNATAITQSPVTVRSFPSPMVSMAAGRAHTLAVLSDGSVHAWGANAAGQLGIGSGEARRTEPVQVPGLNLD